MGVPGSIDCAMLGMRRMLPVVGGESVQLIISLGTDVHTRCSDSQDGDS